MKNVSITKTLTTDYNLTAGELKEFLKDIPDDVRIGVNKNVEDGPCGGYTISITASIPLNKEGK